MFFLSFTLFNYFTQPTWSDNCGGVGPTQYQEHKTAVVDFVSSTLSSLALALKLDTLPTAGKFELTVYCVETYQEGQPYSFTNFRKYFPSEEAAVNWLKRSAATGTVPADWSHCASETFGGKFLPTCVGKFRTYFSFALGPCAPAVFHKTDSLVLATFPL